MRADGAGLGQARWEKTGLHSQPHSQPGAQTAPWSTWAVPPSNPICCFWVVVRDGRVHWTGHLQLMTSVPWILPEPNRHLSPRQPCVVFSCQSGVPRPAPADKPALNHMLHSPQGSNVPNFCPAHSPELQDPPLRLPLDSVKPFVRLDRLRSTAQPKEPSVSSC